ncbi:hypothetical protein DGG96_18115 [Legionella qingyii]|uniref:Uncharacterized protein n=1 Tax=Legionella qingyii TaxID=2184757 RepID=A0A317TXQ0_9GAMM|nr:hypothetical protein DGG96_18115 [Legionella qingyii]
MQVLIKAKTTNKKQYSTHFVNVGDVHLNNTEKIKFLNQKEISGNQCSYFTILNRGRTNLQTHVPKITTQKEI